MRRSKYQFILPIRISNLVFAKLLSALADPKNKEMMEFRCHHVLDSQQIHGDILEIGSGTGINFPCLQKNDRIRSYVGIEPNIHMFPHFYQMMENYQIKFDVRLLNNSATNMSDIPSNSIDTAIMTLVFCSIPDPLPEKVLLEIHRILKPGGKFFFLEHVLSDPNTKRFTNNFQRFIEPVWAIIGDGCQFKPIANYFDAVRGVFAEVSYETTQLPMPIFFVRDAIKGQLTK